MFQNFKKIYKFHSLNQIKLIERWNCPINKPIDRYSILQYQSNNINSQKQKGSNNITNPALMRDFIHCHQQ